MNNKWRVPPKNNSDLYRALIHVPTGDLSTEDVLDAYLRATCVAAGVRYDPAFLEQVTEMFHQRGDTTSDT